MINGVPVAYESVTSMPLGWQIEATVDLGSLMAVDPPFFPAINNERGLLEIELGSIVGIEPPEPYQTPLGSVLAIPPQIPLTVNLGNVPGYPICDIPLRVPTGYVSNDGILSSELPPLPSDIDIPATFFRRSDGATIRGTIQASMIGYTQNILSPAQNSPQDWIEFRPIGRYTISGWPDGTFVSRHDPSQLQRAFVQWINAYLIPFISRHIGTFEYLGSIYTVTPTITVRPPSSITQISNSALQPTALFARSSILVCLEIPIDRLAQPEQKLGIVYTNEPLPYVTQFLGTVEQYIDPPTYIGSVNPPLTNPLYSPIKIGSIRTTGLELGYVPAYDAALDPPAVEVPLPPTPLGFIALGSVKTAVELPEIPTNLVGLYLGSVRQPVAPPVVIPLVSELNLGSISLDFEPIEIYIGAIETEIPLGHVVPGDTIYLGAVTDLYRPTSKGWHLNVPKPVADVGDYNLDTIIQGTLRIIPKIGGLLPSDVLEVDREAIAYPGIIAQYGKREKHVITLTALDRSFSPNIPYIPDTREIDRVLRVTLSIATKDPNRFIIDIDTENPDYYRPLLELRAGSPIVLKLQQDFDIDYNLIANRVRNRLTTDGVLSVKIDASNRL